MDTTTGTVKGSPITISAIPNPPSRGLSNRFRFLLVGLVWGTAVVWAQPLTDAQKISYRRDIPNNVAHAVPRRATRLFWGTFVPKTGALPIGIQLYETKAGVSLDLWQKNSKRFVRINRMPRLYEDPVPGSAKFSVDFYWLDRTQKTTPVLMITQITYGDDNLLPGDYRETKVISLSSGWKSHPSIQTFYDGNSNAGIDGFFAGYSRGGQLELTTFSGDQSGSTKDTYAWDGKQFSVVPEKRVFDDNKEPDG